MLMGSGVLGSAACQDAQRPLLRSSISWLRQRWMQRRGLLDRLEDICQVTHGKPRPEEEGSGTALDSMTEQYSWQHLLQVMLFVVLVGMPDRT